MVGKEHKPIPVTSDPRFSKLHFDPRFIRPQKDASKLKIDSRFAAMLNSDEFGSGAAKKGPKIDKYGRPTKSNVKKDLQRFYKLEDEEETKDKDERETSNVSGSDQEDEKVNVSSEGSENEDELNVSEGSDEDETEAIPGYDLARGEGLIESSDEEEGMQDVELDEEEDDEAQEESDVPTGEETHRLAVVNLDWDYIRSKDLYKLFDGFKPGSGFIRSVRIYPSEFGKERMAKEEESGPLLFQEKEEAEEKGPLIKEDSGEEFCNVLLRKYQLERLKYYYAIVECDSVKTAKAIYESCDGAEFEASANFLDLRYVPDGTAFDDEPRDEASEAPVGYQPAEFTTRALQHSKVKLTWDEDDHERTRVTHRKFSKDDLKDMDFKVYLASDSEDEEVEDPDAIRAKYKSLLGGSDDDADGRDAPQEDMEITFISGLSEKAAGRMEAKKQEEERKNESVFETQLRKRREKKKERRKDRETGNVKEDDDLVEDPLVDGEDVIDEEDPFFQLDDESDFEPVAPKAPVKKEDVAPKKKNAKKTKEELQEEGRSKAELELLFMDENATSERHFNMKSVIQAEKESKRKRNRKKKTKGPELGDTQDDFQLDVQDSRFADIIDSHHFAIDPTNPQFKKTKNMDKLLQMRRDQRAKTVDQVVENAATGPKQEKAKENKSDLRNLVASIKRKTDDRGAKQGPKRPRF